MFLLALLVSSCGIVAGEKLLFAQLLWRHGLRTPEPTYANDPYDEAFFGMPDGELVEKGMVQHFIRGQQLRKMYVDEHRLVSPKYSRYETYVRSADKPRCSQSALANLAGFYADPSTYPSGVPQWPPSSWTPVPIHTVPFEEDYILETDDICAKYSKLQNERMQRKEFKEFLESNWRLLHIINANSGDPQDDSFMSILGMVQSLEIEKALNLTMPDWVTDDFFDELEAVYQAGYDYFTGNAGFGLPMDPEMVKLSSGFLLEEWIDNIDAVIDGTSTLKYYAYSGRDSTIISILNGLGMKDELVGPGNPDYASTIICELWMKNEQYFVKLLFSPDVNNGFKAFTRKLRCCDSDLCLLSEFRYCIAEFVADNAKICDV